MIYNIIDFIGDLYYKITGRINRQIEKYLWHLIINECKQKGL